MATDYASVALVAAGAFVSTNVDNLTMAAAQFALARPERVRRILAGQAVTFALVVVVAALTTVALASLSARWFGLLGAVPLALGVRGLLALRHRGDPARQHQPPPAAGFFAAVAITLAASGDNLAVYIPLFRVNGALGDALTAGVLAALEVGLLALAVFAGRHPATLRTLERAGAYAAPVLYLVIGVVVVVRAGTFSGL